MRNLKRALSLLLAAAMLIGMMVVGASAAGSLDDFSDKDEIVNQDAVSLLTILGVIEGKEDGSYFDPTGNVTRAEMAKMIATILNQGADVDGLYTGMNTGLTDVKGHWAESYINYCYSLGIIAGRGNGKFDPGATVTGNEAAKMLLVAAGYDASIEGLTGNDWAIRTAALASTLGIFDNLNAPTGAPLTRDNAALLVYNALDIEMIQSYQNGYAIAYDDNRTILSTKYGVYRLEGVVVGNEWAYLDGTDSDEALAAGKTRLSDIRLVDSDTVNTRPGVDDGQSRPDTTFNVSTSVDLLGQTVTMYVRNTTVLANAEVLGVYLKDGANTVVTSVNTEDTLKDFLKGTGLSEGNGTEYYVNYGEVASVDDATAAMDFGKDDTHLDNVQDKANGYGVELTVIDNDQDGIVDYVLYLQESLSQVIAKNNSKETTTINAFNNNKAIDDEDIVTEADLAESDLVLVVEYGGRYYVSEPQVVTGQMESYQASKTKEQTIKVDGTDYHPSYIQYKAATADNTYEFDIQLCDQDNGYTEGVQFDTDYDFILDSNGNVIAFQPSEAGLYDYALVLDSGYEPGAFASDASGKVKVLLPDGTEGTYTLNFSASAKNVGEQIADVQNFSYKKNQGIQELKGFLGTADSDLSATAPWEDSQGTHVFADEDKYATDFRDGNAKGYVIGYSLTEDDVLTITSIVGSTDDIASKAIDKYNDTNVDYDTDANYSSGSGRIRFDGNADQVAVDRNTVAFYYTNGGDDYGVAVGYNEMSDVTNAPFVAEHVRSTTDLAGVVLFDAVGVQAEKDYVFVLSKNTVSSSRAVLNVVYMDGTVGEMTIDRDDYDDIFRNDTDFGTAYAYRTGSNGISTLTPADDDVDDLLPVIHGYAWQVNDGTVAVYSDKAGSNRIDRDDAYDGTDGTLKNLDGYTFSYDKQIWNVEDVDEGDEKAPAGSFSRNVGREVVMILDTKCNEVRAAYILDVLDGGAASGDEVGADFRITWDEDNATVRIFNPEHVGAITLMNEITNLLEREGYTDVDFNNALNINNDQITTQIEARIGDNGPRIRNIQAINVYQVTRDGKSAQYLANGEDYEFKGTNGDTYLVNKTTASAADVTVNAAGEGKYTVVSTDKDANNCFDLKTAYSVEPSANLTIKDSASTPNTATNDSARFWVSGTELTVVPDTNYALDPDCALADLVDSNMKFELEGNVAPADAVAVRANIQITFTNAGSTYMDARDLPRDVIVMENSEYTLPSAVPANSGYQFIGWMTDSNKLYQAGDKLSVGSTNIELTPIFVGLVATDTTAVATGDKVNAAAAKVTIETNATAAIQSAFSKAVATVNIANDGSTGAVEYSETSTRATANGTALTFASFSDDNSSATMAGWAAGDTIALAVTVTFEGNATTTFTATLTET